MRALLLETVMIALLEGGAELFNLEIKQRALFFVSRIAFPLPASDRAAGTMLSSRQADVLNTLIEH